MTQILNIGAGTVAFIPNVLHYCEHCGESIAGDGIDLPGGDVVCGGECASLLGYEQCRNCQDWFDAEEARSDPDGNPLCPDCLERYYTRCHNCGDLTPNEYSYSVKGRDYHVCLTCRDNDSPYCDGCGHLVHHNQMGVRYCDNCEAEDTDVGFMTTATNLSTTSFRQKMTAPHTSSTSVLSWKLKWLSPLLKPAMWWIISPISI